MVSAQGTARESATLSILVPLPLLSLQKEEGRDVLHGERKVLEGERGQIHCIPITTRTSLSMDTANGLCRADASSAKTVSFLTRRTAPLRLARVEKVATTVRGKRVRLQRKTHPEVSHRKGSLRLREDHHPRGKRSLPVKAVRSHSATGENLDGKAPSADQGRHSPVGL